jgi:hypothetical protein
MKYIKNKILNPSDRVAHVLEAVLEAFSLLVAEKMPLFTINYLGF